MPKFGKQSLERLATCDARLQEILNNAIKRADFTVLCGHRGQKEQDEAFAKGNSKLKWPKGKHNTKPSLAVDVAPFPIDWNNIKRFKELAKIIKEEAAKLGYKIAYGGDWKSFPDYPHFEIEPLPVKVSPSNDSADNQVCVSLEDIENDVYKP